MCVGRSETTPLAALLVFLRRLQCCLISEYADVVSGEFGMGTGAAPIVELIVFECCDPSRASTHAEAWDGLQRHLHPKHRDMRLKVQNARLQ